MDVLKVDTGTVKGTFSFRLTLLFAGIAVLILSRLFACKQIYELCRNSKDFSGLLLVPVFTCLTIWQTREKLFRLRWGTFLPALIPLVIIVVLQLFGLPATARGQIFMLIISIELAVLAVMGWAVARYITVFLLMSFLTIPPPDWLWQEITLIMQYLSLKVSAFIYGLFSPIYCEGFSIFLHSCQRWGEVTEQCSGARSVLGLCIIGWFLILRTQVSVSAKLTVASSIPLIAFSFNVCRILLMMTLWSIGFEEYTTDFWHGLYGIIAFLLSVSIVLLFIRTAQTSRKHQ